MMRWCDGESLECKLKEEPCELSEKDKQEEQEAINDHAVNGGSHN